MDFTQSPFEQGIGVEQPELNTGLTDYELNDIIDARVRESKTAYERMSLTQRRKTNNDFYLGKQVKEDEVVGLSYVDNVINQDLEQRIKLAVGRTPDIILTPGDNSLIGRQHAAKIGRVLDIDISNKEKKRLLKNGLRHNHLNLIGIAKTCWNPNKGMFGDYEFNIVDPEKVLIAHNGHIPEDGYTSDNCDLIVEIVEEPIATVMAKFPHKRQQLMEMLGTADGSRLASTLKYQEIWYTYHSRSGQIIEGVCWRYNHLILRNMRNPYFDFQGYDRVIYGQNGMPMYNQFGQVATQHVFRNFFERPRKPYIFFSYNNLGKTPLDDTTAVEQAIPLQRNLNKVGKQIRDITDGMQNRLIFSGKVSADQVRDAMNNPKAPLHIESDEDIRTMVTAFTNPGPPVTLFNEMIQTRQQIDAKFQTQGSTKGEMKAAESGVSKQITREGDLVTSDDIVEIVVERVIEEMAGWAIQFMKLMYVDAHFKSKMGKDGELIQETLQRDEIDDGVGLSVRSSTADKSTARNIAMGLGEAGAIDPMTMFEEMDAPNPKERTKRLMLFKLGEGEMGDGFSRYMQEIGINDVAPETPQVPPDAMAQMQQQLTGAPQAPVANPQQMI
jgi:hypothetical protein